MGTSRPAWKLPTQESTNPKSPRLRPVVKKLGTTSDQIIQVVSDGKPFKLRRMGYRDVKTGEHYVYQTNHFTLSARIDAEIYKERW